MRTLTITPGFFRTARIPLLRGREFTAADNKDAPRVALIDEEAARTWFPNQDPIGRQFRSLAHPEAGPKWVTIIGIVRPVIFDRLVRKRVYPVAYYAQAQDPERYLSVALRTKTDPKSFVNAARGAVLATNKDVPIYRIATMDEVVATSFWDRRFFSSLFTIFAGLALFLASLGLYGVMDYNVRQRTQEIGVRMALGAQSADVLRMIAGHGMRLIGLGLGVGFLGAYFLMQSNTYVSDMCSGVLGGADVYFVGGGVVRHQAAVSAEEWADGAKAGLAVLRKLSRVGRGRAGRGRHRRRPPRGPARQRRRRGARVGRADRRRPRADRRGRRAARRLRPRARTGRATRRRPAGGLSARPRSCRGDLPAASHRVVCVLDWREYSRIFRRICVLARRGIRSGSPYGPPRQGTSHPGGRRPRAERPLRRDGPAGGGGVRIPSSPTKGVGRS